MTSPPTSGSASNSPLPERTLYIADRNLNIVYVNGEWVEFARSNRGDQLIGDHKPLNLLESMSGSAKMRWQSIYKLLLEGQLSHHEEQFNCSSPVQRRLFRLRITPERDQTGRVTHLIHHTVPVQQADQSDEHVVEQVAALSDSPENIRQAYRTRVIERSIEITTFNTDRYFRPVDETGGDLIWHHCYANGAVDLVLADVMGHGERASLTATQLSYLLDELAKPNQPIATIVRQLNDSLERLHHGGDTNFVTGIFLRSPPQQEHLHACNFGHEGPIFSQSGLVQVEAGPPVGLAADLGDWPEVLLRFSEHGRRFLMFTDGVPEQFNAEGDMFTVAGLERAFLENLQRPLSDLVAQIVARLEAFRGEALIKDDQTLLAMEFIGER